MKRNITNKSFKKSYSHQQGVDIAKIREIAAEQAVAGVSNLKALTAVLSAASSCSSGCSCSSNGCCCCSCDC